MVCDLKMSASESVSAAVIKWNGFVNDWEHLEITGVCIRRTSNTGPQQEEQHAVGNIGGQL